MTIHRDVLAEGERAFDRCQALVAGTGLPCSPMASWLTVVHADAGRDAHSVDLPAPGGPTRMSTTGREGGRRRWTRRGWCVRRPSSDASRRVRRATGLCPSPRSQRIAARGGSPSGRGRGRRAVVGGRRTRPWRDSVGRGLPRRGTRAWGWSRGSSRGARRRRPFADTSHCTPKPRTCPRRRRSRSRRHTQAFLHLRRRRGSGSSLPSTVATSGMSPRASESDAGKRGRRGSVGSGCRCLGLANVVVVRRTSTDIMRC